MTMRTGKPDDNENRKTWWQRKQETPMTNTIEKTGNNENRKTDDKYNRKNW